MCLHAAGETTGATVAKVSELKAATGALIGMDHFKAVVAGAAVGAVVAGTGGAATGVAYGVVVGASLGLLAAPLTLGLSIPVGAVLGGSTGAAVGMAAGSSSGLLGGGAVGYGLYRHRDELRSLSQTVQGSVQDSTERLKGGTISSLQAAKERVHAARLRLEDQAAAECARREDSRAQ